MLDPGHGGSASGTVAGGLTEKELALDIAVRVRELLSDRYRVAMTREADIDVELDRRSGIANRAGADLFVSIHVNWLPRNRTCGVETYYLGPTDDPELTALAERENAEAHGYSLADLRRLVDGVYGQHMQDESRALADAVQDSLFEKLRAANPELRNRGVKSAPFVVLIDAGNAGHPGRSVLPLGHRRDRAVARRQTPPVDRRSPRRRHPKLRRLASPAGRVAGGGGRPRQR